MHVTFFTVAEVITIVILVLYQVIFSSEFVGKNQLDVDDFVIAQFLI